MKKVEKDYRASELEDAVISYWKQTDAYRKTKERRSSAKPFFFMDGPPYTTGSVHVGTAWNKILKDLYIRYFRMRGFNVRDQPGYDMHGLPIEVRVEQKIGTKNKIDIEEYGVEKFVETCRQFALEFRDRQTEQFARLGVWMDWDNPYQTIDRPYISSVWWTLNEIYKKGLITKSHRVLPWCPRCETALAEAEIEYWDETDPSIYVRFPLIDTPDESIVIWTTTPWTIPGNIAAAVHPDEIYARVEVKTALPGETEILIVMKSLVESAMPSMGYPEYEVVGDLQGSDLLGKKYGHPLLDVVPAQQSFDEENIHSVVVSDTVAKENTGIVHIAPGHGPEDFEIGKAFGLPAFCPVDEQGVFTADAGERYGGKSVQEGGKLVLDDLHDSGLLIKEDSITHRYGHCWRCKTPIIYRTTEQWFMKIPDVKDDILRSNETVKWYPEWAGASRQRDWIINARDWCISRQRYWGTPLPLWQCDCGETLVISGYDELRTADGFTDGMDLHRPWIDRLTFPCGKCGGTMHRVQDVLDVWLDSGVCTWASLGYPEKQGEFEQWWPAEWITEAHDQTRGWFYSQLALGTIVLGKSPFKSVLMHGWALDSVGKRMSKSVGTEVDLQTIITQSGADSLRLYLLGAGAPWEDMSFQKSGPTDANRFLNILWNVYKFAALYMSLDAFDASINPLRDYISALKPEDRWILSRLERVKTEVATHLDEYEPHEAKRKLEKFIIDDLSRWYVRLIRDRLWIEGESTEKTSAFAVLYRVLRDSVVMIAPFAPHISEEIYRNLDGGLESIHMEDWPEFDSSLIDETLDSGMDMIREIVEKVAGARQGADLNLRWPLKRIIIKTDADDVLEKLKMLEEILLDQTNTKELQMIPIGEEWDELILAVVPNPNAIGKVYRQWSSKIAVLLKSRPAKSIKEGIDKGEYSIGIEGQLVEITPNMVSFTSELPPDVASAEFSNGAIYIDLELTEELAAEGFAREVVRRIQQMRKDMKLDVEEFVKVEMKCSSRLEDYLTEWTKHIAHETRARQISFTPDSKGEYIIEWTISDEDIVIALTNLKTKESIGELGNISGLSLDAALRLKEAGLDTADTLSGASDSDILSLGRIDRGELAKIRAYLRQQQPRMTAPAPPVGQTSVPIATPAPVAEPPVSAQPSVPEKAEEPTPQQRTDVIRSGEKRDEISEEKLSSIALEKSFTYLIEEERPETSYKLFLNQLKQGMKGFCITRNYPAKIRTRFPMGDTPIIWLSNVGKDNAIRPKDLEKINLSIVQTLAENEAVVLLDGLEYLITNNNFVTVLRLLQSLRDQVAIHQSILILAVNPATLESHQLNLLEREVDGTIHG